MFDNSNYNDQQELFSNISWCNIVYYKVQINVTYDFTKIELICCK